MADELGVIPQRDIVANVLRENGVLGTIKAQLRSNVYLALDDGKELRVSANQTFEFIGNSIYSYFYFALWIISQIYCNGAKCRAHVDRL